MSRAPSPFPATGPAVPAFVVRAVTVLLSVGLAVLVMPPQPAVACAIGALIGAVWPWTAAEWVVIAALAVGQLARGLPGPGDVSFHVLLLGVPLLHALAARSRLWPPLARVELRALGRPGLRLLGGQVVLQILATAALWLFGAGSATYPVAGVVAVAGLVGAGFVARRSVRGATAGRR
ncbi:hypothetical protein [Luteimicrobium subarcticum]|uniref:Uncharacterized protein n=1 Tax=Luteimicrobium subarcticum TaxID=620910 RepID=A0A2M8W1M7_9MICO|nr:hypothetical protein [Luteimicrobium subarcticum]PJI84820.1 hypothetical protein CLV34_3065 [Luteimicrobium subarcticum]